MAILVGSVEVDVVPNAQGFIGALRRELTPQAVALGNTLGRRIADGINKGVRTGLRDPLNNLPGDPAAAGARSGARFGGAFDDTVQTRIRAALADLPTADIDVSTTAADTKLNELRAELATLADKRIGVDIDATGALAEVDRIQLALTKLGAESASVQVRADTAQAAAQLAGVAAAVAELDGKNVDIPVDVNDGGSIGRLQAIALAGFALGPAIVPVAAAATLAIGAIGPMAVSAAAGLGVLALAFHGINQAVTDTAAATASASKDAAASATAQAAAAQAVSNAQDAARAATTALANTVANADSAAVRSAQAVVSARRGVASAVAQSAAANVAAAAASAAAEKTVQAAVRASAAAVLDLIAARKTAQRQLEDFSNKSKDGALAERAAVIAVADAQDALNLARLDPLATPQSIAAAQLGYDQAVQALDEQRTANKRLAVDKADADKKGVAGSDLVKNAQQRVIDAVDAEAAARTNAAKALKNIDKVKIDGAQRVADAELGVTKAIASQADQARQSAAAITSAQVAVKQSATTLATAQAALVTAQTLVSTAGKKAAASLAGLSPAGQSFVGFINDQMRPAIKNVRDAAQEGLLPGVQSALENLLPFMPRIAKFVGVLAKAMGDLLDASSKALGDPFWQDFFTKLSKSIIPAVRDMGKAIGNLVTGFAGIVAAFIPVNAVLGDGIVELTAKFADWSKGLAESDGFKAFVKYATDNAPLVLSTLAEIGKMLGNIVKAAAPLGPIVLAVLKLIAATINAIPTPVLTVVIAMLGGLAIAMGAISAAAAIAAAKIKLWTAYQWLLDAALDANPIGLVIIAIGLLVVAVVLIVKHLGGFKHVGEVVWNWFKKNWPLLTAIIAGPVGIAVLLIMKHWDTVKAGASAVWNWITAGFDKLIGYFGGLGGQIADVARGMWQGLLEQFKAVINNIIDLWNNISFTIGGGNIAGIDIPQKTFDTKDIPHLATGGVTRGPTVALIGEQGPEAVVPLTDSRLLAQLLGQIRPASVTGESGRNVTVQQVINNPLPERASVSGPAGLRRAALVLGA